MLGEVATFYTTLTVNHSLLQLEWMPNFIAIYKQVLKQKNRWLTLSTHGVYEKFYNCFI